MTDLRKAAQQALEAMIEHGSPYLGHESAYQSAIYALRAALAEPEQVPVAWVDPKWIDPDTRGWPSDSFESVPIEGWLPLYTAPTPHRPLTYDELEPLCEAFDSYDTTQNELVDFARAIEKAHGIGEQT